MPHNTLLVIPPWCSKPPFFVGSPRSLHQGSTHATHGQKGIHFLSFYFFSPFCVTLDFKLFIDSIHILFLLYLLLWFWDFNIKNLQDFIKIYRALIKDIFLPSLGTSEPTVRTPDWSRFMGFYPSLQGLPYP